MSTSRRDFLTASAAAAAGLALPRRADASPFISVVDRAELASGKSFAGRPAVVASANGLRGVKVAYDRIVAGSDPLDAAIAGVNIQELDPEDQSVGLGGLPNADGVVQLDASCMHGPTKRAGSVAALEDIATPSLVAKAVMDYTDHIMLVGAGARRFAIEMGFTPQNLLTEKSRQYYLRWKANLNPDDNWLDHKDDVKIAKPRAAASALVARASGERIAHLVRRARRPAHVRHDQHERRDGERRHRLGDDDVGAVVEDPRPHRRQPDHRGRAVLRQRGRRGGIDGARRGEHQGVRRLPRRGVHADGDDARSRADEGDGARDRDDGDAPARTSADARTST